MKTVVVRNIKRTELIWSNGSARSASPPRMRPMAASG